MKAATSIAFDSPIGAMTVRCTPLGMSEIIHEHHSPAQNDLHPYATQILDYLSGKRTQFDIPLHIESGTLLQRRVWQELLRIPYGQTISYSELADRCGAPKAVRAVASACGKNPIPLIIPCHRIIGKDGALGGFAWGLETKYYLLALEQGECLQEVA